MALSSAFNAALGGLRIASLGLELTSTNIARAGEPGYTRKVRNWDSETKPFDRGFAAPRSPTISRVFDAALQTLVRDLGGAAEAEAIKSAYLARLASAFGGPDDPGHFVQLVSDLRSHLSQLAQTPEADGLRHETGERAQRLASRMRELSDHARTMLDEVEGDIGARVEAINARLVALADVNRAIGLARDGSEDFQNLADRRDLLVMHLARDLDLTVREKDNGQVALNLRAGPVLSLHEGALARFSYTPAGSVALLHGAQGNLQSEAGKLYLGVGQQKQDVSRAMQSERAALGALFALRDQILPESQARLDDFAHALAMTFGRSEQRLSPSDGGAFTLDLADLRSGDQVRFVLRVDGQVQRVTLVGVESDAALPLPEGASDGTRYGFDLSLDAPQAALWLRERFGDALSVRETGEAKRLEIIPRAGTSDLDIALWQASAGLADQSTAVPFFLDGNAIYRDARGEPAQRKGFASRIRFNSDGARDPSFWVGRGEAGDPTRLLGMLARFDEAVGEAFLPHGRSSGGGLEALAGHFVAYESARAASAGAQAEQVGASFAGFEARYHESLSVDLDVELAQLQRLQQAYLANARVLSMIGEAERMLLSALS